MRLGRWWWFVPIRARARAMEIHNLIPRFKNSSGFLLARAFLAARARPRALSPSALARSLRTRVFLSADLARIKLRNSLNWYLSPMAVDPPCERGRDRFARSFPREDLFARKRVFVCSHARRTHTDTRNIRSNYQSLGVRAEFTLPRSRIINIYAESHAISRDTLRRPRSIAYAEGVLRLPRRFRPPHLQRIDDRSRRPPDVREWRSIYLFYFLPSLTRSPSPPPFLSSPSGSSREKAPRSLSSRPSSVKWKSSGAVREPTFGS